MTKKCIRDKLTVSQVYDVLLYDRNSGEFTWKHRHEKHFTDKKYQKIWNSKYAGKLAGSIGSDGYRTICIHGMPCKSHRLVWLVEFGCWPDEIDHINHNRLDNRISNLRDVSHNENSKNYSLKSNNSSGVTGVRWDNIKSMWFASIGVNYKTIFIGRFKSFDKAVAARKAAEVKCGFHENHGQDMPPCKN